ncbi:hypothetical protein TWF694_010468 [Orbilia ellipsospora]|uniref:Uncharacterized protein n=1 Tax=Orbilia ellipsospora TaxID=2528407 RepID=A0AAV9X9Z2_9PEZI
MSQFLVAGTYQRKGPNVLVSMAGPFCASPEGSGRCVAGQIRRISLDPSKIRTKAVSNGFARRNGSAASCARKPPFKHSLRPSLIYSNMSVILLGREFKRFGNLKRIPKIDTALLFATTTHVH